MQSTLSFGALTAAPGDSATSARDHMANMVTMITGGSPASNRGHAVSADGTMSVNEGSGDADPPSKTKGLVDLKLARSELEMLPAQIWRGSRRR